MATSFRKLRETMKNMHISSYKMIKTDKIINRGIWDRIAKNESVSTNTIEKLCLYLSVTPNDVMEFLPDETDENCAK